MTDVTTEDMCCDGECRGAVDPNVVTEEGRKWYKKNDEAADKLFKSEGWEGCLKFGKELLSQYTFEEFARAMRDIPYRHGRSPFSTMSTEEDIEEYEEYTKRNYGHWFKKSP